MARRVYKVRWTDDAGRISRLFTTVEGRTIRVHAIGGTVNITTTADDAIEPMRERIGTILAGTPAGMDSTASLLELAL